MEDAHKVFEEMRQIDVIVWNLMVRGFCKSGDVDMGFRLFRTMRERNVVSWNTMIASLAQDSRYKDAFKLFSEMLDCGFEPDEATLVTALPVCGRLGAFGAGQWIHSYAKSSGLFRNVIRVGNSLVDFYCKSGALETAFQVFNEMPRKNVISWNSMISGLAFNGKGELGVEFFDKMMRKGLHPNDSTFVGVLSCCAHAGLVDRGRDLFASMRRDNKIEPKIEHYGCMVDLLGRSGFLQEAYGLIRSMPVRPNAALWGALLSACCTHSDAELAKCAANELIILEPWNSGNYVLLSNIYAEEGKWDEVAKVRALMREKSVKKVLGSSTVQ